MSTKVTISYDLHTPGQHYRRIQDAIKALGPASKVLFSQWEVETSHTPSEVDCHLRQFLDDNDKLYVASVLASVSSGGLTAVAEGQEQDRPDQFGSEDGELPRGGVLADSVKKM